LTKLDYGRTGSGATGATSSSSTSPIRLKSSNLFDAEASTLKSYLGSGMAWTPLAGSQLVTDFDDGSSTHDALGRLIDRSDIGLGWAEGLIASGNSGTSYAYFLLQFTGVRGDPDQILSVDFATRNGTASAGSNYIAVRGSLHLYPNENSAVIPVEIIGDTTPEPAETFFMDVFNPVGGSFGVGVVTLTAMRTILNDDGWFR